MNSQNSNGLLKQALIFSLIVFHLSFIFRGRLSGQITRGAEPSEIYLSTDWYMDNNGHVHYAIFHSTNNGANIYLQYENIETPPGGEMRVGGVLGDAAPGALYNFGNNELWISFDFGGNWVLVENYTLSGFYTAGSIEGEIYKNGTDVSGTLFFSENYGTSFNINNTDIKFYIEVGTEPGELYGKSGLAGIGYNLKYSYDYGQNFLTIPLDSIIAFWAPGGFQPRISRGIAQGEIYLVSWWLNSNYKIFHSVDTGFTWTEKFESDYIDIYYWRVTYTAGRNPGSFYVMRSRINPQGDHVWLYIDYSSDYGETFTTYFHDLDSLYTSVPSLHKPELHITTVPNPLKTNTTINFQLPEILHDPLLTIYDLHGKQIKQFDISGKHSQNWDGTDESGTRVKNRMYFFNIINTAVKCIKIICIFTSWKKQIIERYKIQPDKRCIKLQYV